MSKEEEFVKKVSPRLFSGVKSIIANQTASLVVEGSNSFGSVCFNC